MLPNEQLRRERQRRGWSRQFVAEQLGVADPKTIGRWERGVAFPSSYFLQRLCTLFGMLAQDLGLFPFYDSATPPLLVEIRAALEQLRRAEKRLQLTIQQAPTERFMHPLTLTLLSLQAAIEMAEYFIRNVEMHATDFDALAREGWEASNGQAASSQDDLANLFNMLYHQEVPGARFIAPAILEQSRDAAQAF